MITTLGQNLGTLCFGNGFLALCVVLSETGDRQTNGSQESDVIDMLTLGEEELHVVPWTEVEIIFF